MFAETPLAREVADRQVTMFAAFVGRGLYITRAALAAATKIPDSSLREYAAGAAMPFAVVLTLAKALPREAINMIAEPGNIRLVDIDAADTNWDALACTASGLVGDICEARADGAVDHQEEARLRKRTRELIAQAQNAVSED